MLSSLLWLLLFVGGGIFLAYQRIDLKTSTVLTGVALVAYTFFGDGGILWLLLWAVRDGQYDDLEGPAHRILMDEDKVVDKTKK